MPKQKNDRFSSLKSSDSEIVSHSNSYLSQSSNKKNTYNNENSINIFKKDTNNKRFESLVTNNNIEKKNKMEYDDNSEKVQDRNDINQNRDIVATSTVEKKQVKQNMNNVFLKNSNSNNSNNNNNINENKDAFPNLPWVDKESYLHQLEIQDKIYESSVNQPRSTWSKLFTTHCDPYNEDCDICYENSCQARQRVNEKKEHYRYIINKYKRENEMQKQKKINEQFNKYIEQNRERIMNSFEYDYVWSEEEKREYLDGYCYYCEKHNITQYNDDDSNNDHDDLDDILIVNKKNNDKDIVQN